MIHLYAAVCVAHRLAEFIDLDVQFRGIARGPAYALQALSFQGRSQCGSSLPSLLAFTHNMESTDPRIKVHAPRSLATDLSLGSILLNYSNSVELSIVM